MRLDETLAFVTVVREGSFTAAGKRLGVPKSTLSRRISELERRVGVRLLQRNTRKVAATEAGAAYYARCIQALDTIDQADSEAASLSDRPQGKLRVSASYELGMGYLPKLLPQFVNLYPDIEVVVELTQERVDLITSGYDVALRGGTLEDDTLIARRLLPSSLVLCASPAFVEKSQIHNLQDLEQHRCLGMMSSSTGAVMPWRLSGPEGVTLVKVRPWVVVNSFALLIELVRREQGVALLERGMVRDELARGEFVQVLPTYAAEGASGAYAIFPNREFLPTKVRAFVDFLAVQMPLV